MALVLIPLPFVRLNSGVLFQALFLMRWHFYLLLEASVTGIRIAINKIIINHMHTFSPVDLRVSIVTLCLRSTILFWPIINDFISGIFCDFLN